MGSPTIIIIITRTTKNMHFLVICAVLSVFNSFFIICKKKKYTKKQASCDIWPFRSILLSITLSPYTLDFFKCKNSHF